MTSSTMSLSHSYQLNLLIIASYTLLMTTWLLGRQTCDESYSQNEWITIIQFCAL